jgi:type I site-specific restriction endonuclease
MTEDKDIEDFFGPVIYSYTAEQAVEDGVLIYTGDVGKEKVYFTNTLFSQGYEDYMKRIELVNKGLSMLSKPDPEDSRYMMLRVIEKDRIWVIRDGQGYTFMTPSDY